ncbi:hypothetical protein D5S17_29025 [Pseudonocardiaceae bacterium YIM PH 21723]|nr:hypothetical protein D5S17_29025 [Pseudonocardiaceae bacterium YIM PH 21723]
MKAGHFLAVTGLVLVLAAGTQHSDTPTSPPAPVGTHAEQPTVPAAEPAFQPEPRAPRPPRRRPEPAPAVPAPATPAPAEVDGVEYPGVLYGCKGPDLVSLDPEPPGSRAWATEKCRKTYRDLEAIGW